MSKLVEIDFNPDARTLRQFGVIAFAGFGTLAGLAFYEKLLFSFGLGDARVPIAAAFMALGTIALSFSAIAPSANRALYVGLALLTFPVGLVLSYVIMGALFFLIIAPIAVLRRVLGSDPMHRRYDPDAPTYWVPAGPRRAKDSYFHQY